MSKPTSVLHTSCRCTDAGQFVYPYTLEEHVLTNPTTSFTAAREQLVADRAARHAFLKEREGAKERARRETLRKVAPGWEPDHAAPLEPTRSTAASPPPPPPPPPAAAPPRGVMDELASLSLSP